MESAGRQTENTEEAFPDFTARLQLFELELIII
jgi:hypothetical protein